MTRNHHFDDRFPMHNYQDASFDRTTNRLFACLGMLGLGLMIFTLVMIALLYSVPKELENRENYGWHYDAVTKTVYRPSDL